MSTSLIAPDILSARPYLLTIDRTSRNLGRFELTSFFASLGSLPAFIADILQHFRPKLRRLDAIVGLDALGFPLAGALGDRLGLPVILARKKGKLALTDGEKLVVGFEDYSVEREGVKGLEIRKDLLKDGMRVIVLYVSFTSILHHIPAQSYSAGGDGPGDPWGELMVAGTNG